MEVLIAVSFGQATLPVAKLGEPKIDLRAFHDEL